MERLAKLNDENPGAVVLASAVGGFAVGFTLHKCVQTLKKKLEAKQKRPLTFEPILPEYKKLLEEGIFVNFHQFYRGGNSKFRHFLYKSLLCETQGFPHFSVYVTSDLYDHVTRKTLIQEDEVKSALLLRSKLALVYSVTNELEGVVGVPHGGLTATLLDWSMAIFAVILQDLSTCLTANLFVRYKKPIAVHKQFIILVEVEKIEGPNVFLKSQVRDEGGNVYCESTSRMVKVDKPFSTWKFRFAEEMVETRDKNLNTPQIKK